VEKGVRGVSGQLLAALIGGGLALLGVFVERFLRSFGRLWCEPSNWKLRFIGGQDPYGSPEELGPERADEAKMVEYSFSLDVFNGKEIPVGLRAPAVVFVCDGGQLVDEPNDAPSGKLHYGRTTYAQLGPINLLPRQWARLEIIGFLGEPGARLLAGWRRVEFVGHRQRRGLLERKEFRKTIASRPPFPDPWKQQ
jgi:hypothetical protein